MFYWTILFEKKEEINIKNCCHCRSTAVDCWFWNVVPDSAFTNTAKRENTYVNALLTRTPKLRGRRRRWSPPLEHFDTSPNTQPAGLPAFFRWRWRTPPASMRKHQPFVIIHLACVWVCIFAHLWQKSQWPQRNAKWLNVFPFPSSKKQDGDGPTCMTNSL